MQEEKYAEFEKFIGENKNQRKFEQSVELAINFKGVDFSKQTNRLNLDVLLPNGKGKTNKLAIFATEKNFIEGANRNGIEVIDGSSLPTIASDKARMNSLLNYDLIAQPNLMPSIAKQLGAFLGPRNKMPKPVMSVQELSRITNDMSKKISIKNKGKFLPTVHCVVGSEKMEARKIYDNIKAVVGDVDKAVGSNRIRSVYVKLTMSKPLRLV
jgi:large subunit ribosomal protein L1